MGMETGVENKEQAEEADKDEAPDLADDQQDSAGRGSTNSAMVPTPSGASQKSGCVSTVTKDCRRRSSLGMIWGEEPAQPRIRRMPRGMNYWSFITVALVLNVAMGAMSLPSFRTRTPLSILVLPMCGIAYLGVLWESV